MKSKRCALIVSTSAISSAPCCGGESTPPIVCRMQCTRVRTDALRRKSDGFMAASGRRQCSVKARGTRRKGRGRFLLGPLLPVREPGGHLEVEVDGHGTEAHDAHDNTASTTA